MRHDSDTRLLGLRRIEMLRLQDASGTLIACEEGTLWITQEGDARDVVIGAGERFVVDRDGLTIVEALDAAKLVLGPEPVLELAA
jgi:hypothetical protein